MPIVVPTPPTNLPTPPTTQDPANFDSRADAFLGALPTFQTQTNALATATYTNAQFSQQQATSAVGSATQAKQSESIALGAANFKGEYSSLTGSLNMPASVKHSGRFWLLVRNVANVTAEVPGVSTAWTSLDSGQSITQQISSNTTGIVGVKYLITGSNVTLTVPTGVSKGDKFGFILCVARTGNQVVDFGTAKVRGKAAAALLLDVDGATADLQFEDTTLGWV